MTVFMDPNNSGIGNGKSMYEDSYSIQNNNSYNTKSKIFNEGIRDIPV